MEDVAEFALTFDEFPPRSIPASFNPGNIMASEIRKLRVERALREAFPMLPEPQASGN